MIGPSAPNGPPVPMAIAADSGLRMATFASMRLREMSTASIASGMPWPSIFGEPYFTIRPMISPPITGMMITQGPSWLASGLRKLERPDVIEGQVGEQADEVVQDEGDQARRQSDARRQQ